MVSDTLILKQFWQRFFQVKKTNLWLENPVCQIQYSDYPLMVFNLTENILEK